MNPKQWIDAVERYMGRDARPYEQRYIARLYDPEETEESARIVARLILDNDVTPVQSVFKS